MGTKILGSYYSVLYILMQNVCESPFYEQGNRGSERLSNLPKVTQ